MASLGLFFLYSTIQQALCMVKVQPYLGLGSHFLVADVMCACCGPRGRRLNIHLCNTTAPISLGKNTSLLQVNLRMSDSR